MTLADLLHCWLDPFKYDFIWIALKVLEYCPGGSLEDLIVQHQNDQKYFKGQESMKIQEYT